jgi:hypothetical protein
MITRESIYVVNWRTPKNVNDTTLPANPLTFRGQSILGLLSEYGPNLMQLNTSLTLAEIHEFLDYYVESEISPKATGPIAEILRSVQRPASKERQNSIGTYQENYLSSQSRWTNPQNKASCPL